MEFTFEITETLQRRVCVEAESKAEACRKVSGMYRAGKIVLDGSDYIDTEIAGIDIFAGDC